MNLSGPQRQKLQEALISAFPNPFKLRQMLSFGLNKSLNTIAGGQNLDEIVFKLIETAESENWVKDLITAALESNSTKNENLIAIAKELLPESSAIPNPQPQPLPNPSPAPTPTLQTPINSLTIPRRMLLKLAGLGGLGLGTAFLIHKFFELFQTSQLQTFEFETVTVDAGGTRTNRRNGEAKYFEENLGNGVTLEMLLIPGGTFTMGSPARR